jgi:hypothetical protein
MRLTCKWQKDEDIILHTETSGQRQTITNFALSRQIGSVFLRADKTNLLQRESVLTMILKDKLWMSFYRSKHILQ